jgi:putative DNA primase/helicase
MLYAPRGLGKSWLALSIGLAVASGSSLLSWSAPRQRNVLYVDGEMPLVSLQERLKAISLGFGGDIPNDAFRILAADQIESGINLSTREGQQSLDPLLKDIDLLILDNLSTLATTTAESASDAWVPMQNWLLRLRRQGVSVLLVHHAGTNGRQRGTSRREDALDTVIALRRPEDYSPEQGARFEVHFEKLRNRVDGAGAIPFEARVENCGGGFCWSLCDLKPPLLTKAAELFAEGLTVREVAAILRISKSEAGRLRSRALQERLFSADGDLDSSDIPLQSRGVRFRPKPLPAACPNVPNPNERGCGTGVTRASYGHGFCWPNQEGLCEALVQRIGPLGSLLVEQGRLLG